MKQFLIILVFALNNLVKIRLYQDQYLSIYNTMEMKFHHNQDKTSFKRSF